MHSMLLEIKKIFCLPFFQDNCRLCSSQLAYKEEERLCCDCLEKIQPFRGVACLCCDRPLNSETEECGECLLEPPVFIRHVSYGLYRNELREVILKYKYGQQEPLKYILALFLRYACREKALLSADYIIPVPRDIGRNREFDHILEMAKVLSSLLNIPLLKKHMKKIKKTPPQAILSRNLRLKNLDGVFRLTDARPSLQGKSVLLIDDVYTTGTTIKKCAALLTRGGASVFAATLARSIWADSGDDSR